MPPFYLIARTKYAYMHGDPLCDVQDPQGRHGRANSSSSHLDTGAQATTDCTLCSSQGPALGVTTCESLAPSSSVPVEPSTASPPNAETVSGPASVPLEPRTTTQSSISSPSQPTDDPASPEPSSSEAVNPTSTSIVSYTSPPTFTSDSEVALITGSPETSQPFIDPLPDSTDTAPGSSSAAVPGASDLPVVPPDGSASPTPSPSNPALSLTTTVNQGKSTTSIAIVPSGTRVDSPVVESTQLPAESVTEGPSVTPTPTTPLLAEPGITTSNSDTRPLSSLSSIPPPPMVEPTMSTPASNGTTPSNETTTVGNDPGNSGEPLDDALSIPIPNGGTLPGKSNNTSPMDSNTSPTSNDTPVVPDPVQEVPVQIEDPPVSGTPTSSSTPTPSPPPSTPIPGGVEPTGPPPPISNPEQPAIPTASIPDGQTDSGSPVGSGSGGSSPVSGSPGRDTPQSEGPPVITSTSSTTTTTSATLPGTPAAPPEEFNATPTPTPDPGNVLVIGQPLSQGDGEDGDVEDIFTVSTSTFVETFTSDVVVTTTDSTGRVGTSSTQTTGVKTSTTLVLVPTTTVSGGVQGGARDGPSQGAVIGGAIGGTILLLLMALMTFICMRRKKNRNEMAIHARLFESPVVAKVPALGSPGISEKTAYEQHKTLVQQGLLKAQTRGMPPGLPPLVTSIKAHGYSNSIAGNLSPKQYTFNGHSHSHSGGSSMSGHQGQAVVGDEEKGWGDLERGHGHQHGSLSRASLLPGQNALGGNRGHGRTESTSTFPSPDVVFVPAIALVPPSPNPFADPSDHVAPEGQFGGAHVQRSVSTRQRMEYNRVVVGSPLANGLRGQGAGDDPFADPGAQAAVGMMMPLPQQQQQQQQQYHLDPFRDVAQLAVPRNPGASANGSADKGVRVSTGSLCSAEFGYAI